MKFNFICSGDKLFDNDRSGTSDELPGEINLIEPSFKLDQLSYVGILDVKFSHRMERPMNITEINNDVFLLKLVIDESNIFDDKNDAYFTWYVESYSEYDMNI